MFAACGPSTGCGCPLHEAGARPDRRSPDLHRARSPQGAVHVRDRIVALIALLQDHPYAGRQTTRAYVRRLPVNPYPYLIDYRVTATEIVIMRFRHAARRPPRTR
ncbi:type II toxin-antitoxin system RelE/ParE family toxin [Bradyrhizobium neotropicale]|uniref:type II toxin-antitoxin system RelE/ParE family toxin n=1 Tax=Bradyrhizobium neotropicale TaxID=1497615 RepID=UPI003221FBB5